MKTIAMIAAAVLSMTTASHAGGFKIEKPCWNKCSASKPAPQLVQPSEFYATCCAIGTVRFVNSTAKNTYSSSSRMVIESRIGGTKSTSVIDSTYRSVY